MMKKFMLSVVLAAALFMACSKDDANNNSKKEKVCETCLDYKGVTQELCDNGDGTFTRTKGADDVDTFTLKQLENVGLGTFELWVNSNCEE